VRTFVEKELVPHGSQWEDANTGGFPEELRIKAYEAGIMAAAWPEEFGGTPPDGGWDFFKDLIQEDELMRCGYGGILASLKTFGIGLPPILMAGPEWMKQAVVRDIVTGRKSLALAVSEPSAGSDVANLLTTAEKGADGQHYIVNGEKKWITGGMKADFFTVAVRTGGAGMKGISLLLIEKDAEGFEKRRMPTQGWWSSNTAYLVFDNVA